MTEIDIDKERERLDKIGRHIEEAEENARELLEPHATITGGPRSTDEEEVEREHLT